MLRLKLQYSGHLMWRANSLEKTLMLGKTDGRMRRGWQRMRWLAGWHPRLNGYEFEQTLGDAEGQGSLASCSPWGHRVRHGWGTEQQQEAVQVAVHCDSLFSQYRGLGGGLCHPIIIAGVLLSIEYGPVETMLENLVFIFILPLSFWLTFSNFLN